MRKTWGRLLRNLNAFDGDPKTTMMTDLAEQEGVEVERIMDALDTLKILRLYNIDVTEATGRTTIFAEDDGPFAAIAASLSKAMNASLPAELQDVQRFDGGIEVGGTTHVKPDQVWPEWEVGQHDPDVFDLIFVDGVGLRKAGRTTAAALFAPEHFEPTVRHRLCGRCRGETVCGLDIYGWKVAQPPYNDWRVAWVDPAMSVLPECEECKITRRGRFPQKTHP